MQGPGREFAQDKFPSGMMYVKQRYLWVNVLMLRAKNDFPQDEL